MGPTKVLEFVDCGCEYIRQPRNAVDNIVLTNLIVIDLTQVFRQGIVEISIDDVLDRDIIELILVKVLC